ncbi:MAG TPA: hypothetical protein VGO89_02990 [Streptomyces sp.]|jgi:hypothetical protein|nr:hypothetical protein [Streptomyces sp.]
MTASTSAAPSGTVPELLPGITDITRGAPRDAVTRDTGITGRRTLLTGAAR